MRWKHVNSSYSRRPYWAWVHWAWVWSRWFLLAIGVLIGMALVEIWRLG